jgi:hypothetical protein
MTTVTNNNQILGYASLISGSYIYTATSGVVSTSNSNNISNLDSSQLVINLPSGRQFKIDDEFFDYFDMISEMIGLPVTFSNYSKMAKKEQKAFLKNMKRESKLRDLDI